MNFCPAALAGRGVILFFLPTSRLDRDVELQMFLALFRFRVDRFYHNIFNAESAKKMIFSIFSPLSPFPH